MTILSALKLNLPMRRPKYAKIKYSKYIGWIEPHIIKDQLLNSNKIPRYYNFIWNFTLDIGEKTIPLPDGPDLTEEDLFSEDWEVDLYQGA